MLKQVPTRALVVTTLIAFDIPVPLYSYHTIPGKKTDGPCITAVLWKHGTKFWGS